MAMIVLNVLLIVIILVGGGYLAKSRFSGVKKKDEKEIWKKNALNYNKLLDEAFQKKKEDDYKNLLHPKVSRFQPKSPHLFEGSNEVMKWVRSDMEAATPGQTSIVRTVSELYDQTLVMTYHYTKVSDKPGEGAGKVTRVWARVADGWKMVHEHISTSG